MSEGGGKKMNWEKKKTTLKQSSMTNYFECMNRKGG